MLSFLDFLAETVTRSKEQIDKLLNYVSDRQAKAKRASKPMNFKDHIFRYIKPRSASLQQPAVPYPHEHAFGGGLKRPNDYHHEHKHIDIHSIDAAQTYVSKGNVKHLAHEIHDNKFDEQNPRAAIHVLHDPRSGRHTVINGHHRLLGARLNRKKKIWAKVSTPKSLMKESLTLAALIAAKIGAGAGALAYARHLYKKSGVPAKRAGRKMPLKGSSEIARGILANNPSFKPIRGIGRGPASKRSMISVFMGKRTPKDQGHIKK
jgi:hypothetical protein